MFLAVIKDVRKVEVVCKREYAMRKQRARKLGKWQVKVLTQIAKKEVCCSRAVIDQLQGSAKNWDRRYKSRLKSAIVAHNIGIATNSPVNPKMKIIEDFHTGFKLLPK